MISTNRNEAHQLQLLPTATIGQISGQALYVLSYQCLTLTQQMKVRNPTMVNSKSTLPGQRET